ncbi:hypothetical protein [Rheinheimera soli]|nr:hypothetical protein [Rheinheimera soli]
MELIFPVIDSKEQKAIMTHTADLNLKYLDEMELLWLEVKNWKNKEK